MSSTQHFTVNQTPGQHYQAMWQLITTMMAAGWTMPQASDGTTTGANAVTASGTGAGGNANHLAYVVMQQPPGGTSPYAGTRQFCIQIRNDAVTNWAIKYSLSGGFTGGTATEVPTATDETWIYGGGTPSAPTFSTMFGGTTGAYRVECMADTGDAGSTTPFGFYLIGFNNGGGTTGTCVAFGMDPVAAYEAGDTDPFVMFSGGPGSTSGMKLNLDLGATSGTNQSDNTHAGYNHGTCQTWYNPAGINSLPAAWNGVQAQGYCDGDGSNKTIPANMGSSPVSGNEVMVPLFWARRADASGGGACGWKGVSMMLRWKASNKSPGDTISTAGAGSKDRLVCGDVSWPWDGSSPVV